MPWEQTTHRGPDSGPTWPVRGGHHVGHETVMPRFPLRKADGERLGHIRKREQGCVDFPWLDEITADLHRVVAPAEDGQPVLVDPPEIVAAVGRAAVGVQPERGVGRVLVAPISRGQIAARDHDGAHLAERNGCVVVR